MIIDEETFKELYKLDFNDNYISRKLNIDVEYIKEYRRINGLIEGKRESAQENPSIKIPQEQLEILCGTLLGDSSLQKHREGSNPMFTTYHGESQREYMQHLFDKLEPIGAKYKEYTRLDKRNMTEHITIAVTTPCNPEFQSLYDTLYDPISNKKIITKKFLENFTIKSLAYLYMDDGYYCRNTAFISTDCFDEESRQNLIDHCQSNFDLLFRHDKRKENSYRLRLTSYDFKLFRYLIDPYVVDSLKYKLNK